MSEVTKKIAEQALRDYPRWAAIVARAGQSHRPESRKR